MLLALMASFYFSSCQKEAAETQLSPNEMLSSNASKGNSGMDKGVPFKGTYTNTHQTLQPPPMFQQKVTGKGNATHLGASSFEAITNVKVTPPAPFAVSGTRTLTAANGDQLFTKFTGISTPLSPGVSRANLHDVITGGTGRFQAASGSFDAVAISDQVTATFEVTFDGYIKF